MRSVSSDVRRRSHPLPSGQAQLVGVSGMSNEPVRSPPRPAWRTPPPPRRPVVKSDGLTSAASAPGGDPDMRSAHSPDRAPLEVAQRVWQRSVELAADDQLDVSVQVLALLHTARHDADTMTHALGLGRSRARHPSNDETTCRGIRLLERAIASIGVKAQPGEIAGSPIERRGRRARAALSLVRVDHHPRDRAERAARGHSEPGDTQGTSKPG
jgi:hypothetical protein